jgi:dihydrofolate synthase/folylpolyglutamate synthase
VNAAVAVAVLRELDARGVSVDEAAVITGLTSVEWPGRLEEFQAGGSRVLLDAAHNPAGARALATFLREAGWTDCALVFAAMRDKDVTGMLAELVPLCGVIVCTTAPTPRAAPADELAATARELFPGGTVESIGDFAAALARACSLRTHVVVAGSIFLIGPVRDNLRAS